MDFRQWNRIRDWVLLLGLIAISMIVMITENLSVVRTLRSVSLEITGQVEGSLSWIGRYFHALEENEILRAENIQLSSSLARSREADIENTRLRRLVGFVDTVSYTLVPARIIEKEITEQKNYLSLNKGRAHGVEKGMGVLDERGILGKVYEVSENYSLVMSYLNMDFRVPAKIQPSQAQGIVRWEGVHRDQLLLEHVIKTENVDQGHLVVTSGYSSVFPPGYPIGVVQSVVPQTGKNQLLINIRPSSQIDVVEHAFIVLEYPENELEALTLPEQ